MHILLIHQAFVGSGEAGGTRHYEFARRLALDGHEFTVVTSRLSYLSGEAGTSSDSQEPGDSIRILRTYQVRTLHRSFPWRIVSFLSFMLSSFWAAAKVRNVDLVMGTTPPIFQALSACLAARLKRKPFLLEVRDLWPDFAIDMGVLKNKTLIFLSRQLEISLYRWADCLVVNSPAYRDYLLKLGLPPAKVHLIPNGVSPEMFHPDSVGETVRKKFDLKDRFVVTYAGAMGPANDLATLISAAAKVESEAPAIHFLLVGDGKERKNLQQQASDLGCHNITFTGAVPKEQIPDFLAVSDVCVAILQDTPGFKTTYPNKVFDYMAAGRPIVLAIDGVIREVVSRAGCGVFSQPGDPAELARSILELHNQPQLRATMGRNGRSHVAEHFNRKTQALDFLKVAEGLVSRGD